MKAASKRVNRSKFYHLLNTITPINHALRVKSDTWGVVFVVGLLFGLVMLVKIFLER